MISKRQILNIVIGFSGLYIMQRAFGEAQTRALQAQPTGWFVFIGIVGLLVALFGAVSFYYERGRNKDYNPHETIINAYKEDSKKLNHKATPAYPPESNKAEHKEKIK